MPASRTDRLDNVEPATRSIVSAISALLDG